MLLRLTVSELYYGFFAIHIICTNHIQLL